MTGVRQSEESEELKQGVRLAGRVPKRSLKAVDPELHQRGRFDSSSAKNLELDSNSGGNAPAAEDHRL